VMVAPIISISSDLSEESVGSHAPRVILFGAIPAIIPVIPEVLIVPADPIVAPEVGTVSVVSPTRVLDLVDYSSSSDSDPSKDSLPLVPDLSLVSPFLCYDDSEADGESEPADADVGISDGVVAHTEDSVGMRVEIAASDVREDDEEFEAEASATDTREIVVDPLDIGDSFESSRGGIPDLEDTIYDIVHYMSEVRIDRITEIETT
ncbi:hypothetical protein Tco_1557776, partial [Tanacetum coccineum]